MLLPYLVGFALPGSSQFTQLVPKSSKGLGRTDQKIRKKRLLIEQGVVYSPCLTLGISVVR